MKTAVVIGATGLIGQILVDKLAQDRTWSQILAITRKPTTWANPKVRTLVFDFKQWESLDLQIQSFGGRADLNFFCCLGTTILAAGSEEAFRKVDHDAVVSFTKVASRCSAENLFVVSALGADVNSSVFYNRTKGEMERDVQAVSLKAVYFLRPSLLLGDRGQFRLFERLAIMSAPIYTPLLFGSLKKYRPVKASSVANAMINIAAKKITASKFIENESIEHFAAIHN